MSSHHRYPHILFILASACYFLLPFDASFAQEIPDSHEIIQKLSASPMHRELSMDALSVTLPNSWEYMLHTDNQTNRIQKLTFRVPFHPGVIGKIQLLNEPANIETCITEIGEDLHTEFQVESQTPIKTDTFEGFQATLSCRLAGEIWKIRLYSGTLANQKNIRFYAQSQDIWFHVYSKFFDEIMNSVLPQK